MEPSACTSTNAPAELRFGARWANTADRLAGGTTAGCRFTCDGGANTCFVRASDALPVELMEFAVEEEDSEK